jgi:hypothetical protein
LIWESTKFRWLVVLAFDQERNRPASIHSW